MVHVRLRRGLAALLVCAFTQSVSPAWAQQPGPKIHISIVEGEGAINNVRQRVAREPIVQVEDENRKPVAGAAVTFLLPNQGAGATFANGARSLTVLTDEQGRAVARGLRANNVNGNYNIRVNASHQGRSASATMSQSNVAAAGAAGGALSGKVIALIVAGVAGAAVGGAVVATRNGNGGGNGGRPGGAASPAIVTPGTPTVGGPQ